MTRVVVTGASGFVGRTVMSIASEARPLRLSGADWRDALRACDLRDAAILHIGARAHAEDSSDDAAYGDAVEKAREVAEAAMQAGARVLVFASTIKVNGEETRERAFRADDAPAPEDAYARSKLAVERELARIAAGGGLAVHVVRPPLVFGASPRGNLAALLRICDSALPLPFASIGNRRSFIAAEDLARLLLACAERPLAGIHTWLAAHPQPFSTSQLFREARTALKRPARLVPFPPRALEFAAAIAGQAGRMRRLTRSLEVDATATCDAFDWQPRVAFDAAVRDMAAAWIMQRPRA